MFFLLVYRPQSRDEKWRIFVWKFKMDILTDRSSENKNSVAWVRQRTIPTERLSLVSEISSNFCG
jgi:hypothetical protein